MRIAIDSSVLIALIDPRDVWRAQAIALMETIESVAGKPTYFDCVVTESVSAAIRRLREKGRAHETAALLKRLNDRAPRQELTWILPDVPRLYDEAMELIRSSAGELNFNDALITLACRERNIPAIASFDPDFDPLPWLRHVAQPSDLAASH